MRRIDIFYAPRYYSHYDTFPLRVFRSYLRKHGFLISFHHSLKDQNFRPSDCAIISGYQVWRVLGFSAPIQLQSLLPRLEQLRNRFNRLVWIDSHDSANIAYRSVLPLVDLYLKKQVWSNKSLYTVPLYGDIVFKHYYHSHYGIQEQGSTFGNPIPESLLPRIQVGWNLALTDWQVHGKCQLVRGRYILLPNPQYPVSFGSRPLHLRRYDIVWRGRTHEDTHSIVAFHRNSVQQQVETASKHLGLSALLGGQVPYRQYLREIYDARIVVSPFGWGEVCFRDFEAFAAGAVLLKPDMGHLNTWPNLYIPYQTYVPFNWDFNDIGEKIEEILSNIQEYQQIALEGQRRFREVLSPSFGPQFSAHFAELLEHITGT